MTRFSHAYAALFVLSACSLENDVMTHYQLQLQAELPDTTPLAGVRFWIAGRELEPTGVDGRASTTLTGRDGDALHVTALCPVGHRGSTEPRVINLQRIATADTKRVAPLGLVWRCVPEQTRAALVVRALRGDTPVSVPILVDGRVVGQTDAQGVAHVVVHSAPHASLQARLDTSALPDLTPRDPVRVFDLEDSDTLLLFDQSFDTRPQPHRHAARRVATRVPLRIQ